MGGGAFIVARKKRVNMRLDFVQKREIQIRLEIYDCTGVYRTLEVSK